MTSLLLAFSSQKQVRFSFSGLSLFEEDDRDIKIAGMEKSKKSQEEETARLAEELTHQKNNGNVDKVRKLGAQAAQNIMVQDVSALCIGPTSGQILLQCRLLMSAAAQKAFADHLPHKILYDVAAESLQQTLQKEYPVFYQQLIKPGAMSFYMLCLRKGNNAPDQIGDVFANLTGREGDVSAKRAGTDLYVHFYGNVIHAIETSKLSK
ncbi:MAG TPA: hypothetical protein DEP42_03915 [Ruminococcaceae bacterium]|nr:hypothetical protein [Oscillospiraceae bacterium]